MFTKEINAQGDVEISQTVTSGLKFLVKLVSFLFVAVILASGAVAVTFWRQYHAYTIVLMCSAVILLTLYKFPQVLVTLKPVRLLLSATKITIVQGKKSTEAAWNNIETFQWDERQSCLSAKRLPTPGSKAGGKANYLLIPASFERTTLRLF